MKSSLKSKSNDDELKMIVHLPRDLVRDTNDATEVKLSITDDDLISTKVSIGEQRIQRSKSNISAKSGIEARSDIATGTASSGMKPSEGNGEGVQWNTTDSLAPGITTDPSGNLIPKLTNTSKESEKSKPGKQGASKATTQKPSREIERSSSVGKGSGVARSTSPWSANNGLGEENKRAKSGSKSNTAAAKVPREDSQSRPAFDNGIGSSKRGISAGSNSRSQRGTSLENKKSTSKNPKKSSASKRDTSKSRPGGRSNSKESRISDMTNKSTDPKRATKNQQRFGPPLTGIFPTPLENDSAKWPSGSRDKDDLRIKTLTKSNGQYSPDGQLSPGQSPRSSPIPRPAIISQNVNVRRKHLASLMNEHFPEKAKVMRLSSKLEKYKRGYSDLLKPEMLKYGLEEYGIDRMQQAKKMSVIGTEITMRRCQCNALRNSNVCNCEPSVCLQPQAGYNPRVCFCANSYKKGYDGKVYHTKCSCFD